MLWKMERVHKEEDGGDGDDDEGFSEQFSSIMGNYKQYLTRINMALNEKVRKSNKHVVSTKKVKVRYIIHRIGLENPSNT
ncbi:unnamed protein product [Dovyalis caffra]|uniref:Uncharacterized protein n=1 Tax=Dovyalis caffra TaxID=77055 RepID=A0AAV1SR36_9ROSI|nr:unnamed protein product [Dovyalis caffra]